MKTWQTVTVTALTTLGLAGAGAFVYTSNQPAHYEGTTFKSSVSSTSEESSSSSSATEEQSSVEAYAGVTTSPTSDTTTEEYNTLYIYAGVGSQICTTRDGETLSRYGFYILCPQQPSTQFRVVQTGADNTYSDDYVIVHAENDDSDQSELNCASAKQNAEMFCKWLRQQAPNGTTKNGLQANYDYWVNNCKYKYK